MPVASFWQFLPLLSHLLTLYGGCYQGAWSMAGEHNGDKKGAPMPPVARRGLRSGSI